MESIIRQTYVNLEVILVDDGSTDSSGKICDELRKTDSRIKVIHKENGGQASARNRGLEVSSGDFISFIDSDDYVDNDFIETLYSAIMNNSSDIVICGYTVIYEGNDKREEFHADSEKRIDTREFWDDVILGQEIIYGAVEPVTKLYRAEIFNNLRFREMRMIEDEEILYDLIKKCGDIVISPYCGYYYLQRKGSTMNRSYSVERLSASGVFIERSRKFFEDGLQLYAECSLMNAAAKMIEGIKMIPDDASGKKETIAALMAEFRIMAKKLIKTSGSLKFKIKAALFSLSPELFIRIFHK